MLYFDIYHCKDKLLRSHLKIQTNLYFALPKCVERFSYVGKKHWYFLIYSYMPFGALFKKYKTFSVLIYSYTLTGRSVFTKFRVFPISTSVDITVYLYRKNVLYFFYNIAQENTKLLQWMSKGKFSVFTSSYVNTAINQSAFRIPKCYIIICYIS